MVVSQQSSEVLAAHDFAFTDFVSRFDDPVVQPLVTSAAMIIRLRLSGESERTNRSIWTFMSWAFGMDEFEVLFQCRFLANVPMKACGGRLDDAQCWGL